LFSVPLLQNACAKSGCGFVMLTPVRGSRGQGRYFKNIMDTISVAEFEYLPLGVLQRFFVIISGGKRRPFPAKKLELLPAEREDSI